MTITAISILHGSLLLLLWLWLFVRHPTLIFPDESPSSSSAMGVSSLPSFPVRREGVVFFSAAPTGPVREAALALTTQGFHVLVGAASSIEQRSFAYLARKGLEIIPFDLQDPSTYPDVVYRLRHIRRDLDRPLVGIVLNVADGVQRELSSNLFSSQPIDKSSSKQDNKKKSAKTTASKKQKTSIERWIDVDYGSDQYRNVIKSPHRVLAALVELAHLQTKEGRNPSLERKLLLAQGVSPQEEKTPKKDKRGEENEWNLGGLRVALLVANTTQDANILKECGLACVYQRTTIDYFQSLAKSEVLRNVSFSIIPTLPLSLSPQEEESLYSSSFAQHVSWVVEDIDSVEENKEKHKPFASKSIVHAFVSRSPRPLYDQSIASVGRERKSEEL